MKFNYDVEFETVKSRMLKTIDSFDGCLKDPPPLIGVENVETDGFTISLNAWVNSHGYQDIKLEFNERLMGDLKEVIHKA